MNHIVNIFSNMLVHRLIASVDLPPTRQTGFEGKPVPLLNRKVSQKRHLLRPRAYQAHLAAQDMEELR